MHAVHMPRLRAWGEPHAPYRYLVGPYRMHVGKPGVVLVRKTGKETFSKHIGTATMCTAEVRALEHGCG